MFVDAFINCDGDWEIEVPDFWDVPEPNIDISTTTPTLPATPPVRVAASAPLCADGTWTVAADATSITGSCFQHNEDYGYEKYEWDFKLAVAAP
jgi:hypothetical protein